MMTDAKVRKNENKVLKRAISTEWWNLFFEILHRKYASHLLKQYQTLPALYCLIRKWETRKNYWHICSEPDDQLLPAGRERWR